MIMAGMRKPNNTLRIPCTKEGLFKYWLKFLTPIHHLTDKELLVASAFLIERYNLSKVVNDEDLLNRILMSEESLRKIKKDCGVSNQHFQVIKSKLKAKGFFEDNKIQDKLIPKVTEYREDGSPEPLFLLLLVFDMR